MKRKHEKKRFVEAVNNFYQTIQQQEQLQHPIQGDSVSAWFLGTKGENAYLLKELIDKSIAEHIHSRKSFHPEDPVHITPSVIASKPYQDSVHNFRKQLDQMLDDLKQSVPFYSMRYQAHMLWDVNLPSVVGYFAAMLYNQNNVAVEASPVTTAYEMRVGADFCNMIGFPETSEITPWGHLTCGGSVANLEGLWMARNLKFYPLALKQALLTDPLLATVQDIPVTLPDGTQAKLIDLNTWTLINLRADDVLLLPEKIQALGVSLDTLSQALNKYSIQNVGLPYYYALLAGDGIQTPIGMTPATKHYSWPKNAAILGIGANNMLNVHVDLDGRMCVEHLDYLLAQCLWEKRPVYTVVAVIGTTEESSVDPLSKIIELREKYRKLGLEFTIHADAAWGGYFASMLREDVTTCNTLEAVPVFPMSDYVVEQMRALPLVDSITVDPHKSGFVPYPAGGLCYRNSRMRSLVSFNAPEIFHHQADPSLGIYGVQGSSPGASAAAVYLSHRVIPLNQSGYGKILGECTFTAKKLYARFATFTDKQFTLVPFTRLPAEKNGGDVEAQKAFIRSRIVGKNNEEVVNDPQAVALMREIGPDQLIINYTLNFKDANGRLNTDLAKLNELNQNVFKRLSITLGENVNQKQLIVTSSSFDPDAFGLEFMYSLCKRLGVQYDGKSQISYLSSCVMDPWLTENTSSNGSFLDEIEDALRNAVHQVLRELNYVTL